MSSLTLKLLAMASMLLDHIGYAYADSLPVPVYIVLRSVGRMAMPIFCFLIAEGLFHTRRAPRYLFRLAGFALVSEVPFDLFIAGKPLYLSGQNVGFTLFFGLMGLVLFDTFAARGQKGASLLSILTAGCLAQLMQTDYGMFGVYYIFVFYYFRGRLRPLAAALATGILLFAAMQYLMRPDLTMPLITLATITALIPIALYSGKPGNKNNALLRYCLYGFYPLHMLILALVGS